MEAMASTHCPFTHTAPWAECCDRDIDLLKRTDTDSTMHSALSSHKLSKLVWVKTSLPSIAAVSQCSPHIDDDNQIEADRRIVTLFNLLVAQLSSNLSDAHEMQRVITLTWVEIQTLIFTDASADLGKAWGHMHRLLDTVKLKHPTKYWKIKQQQQGDAHRVLVSASGLPITGV